MRVGVDHLSLRDVSHRAGLTHGATYARYEDFGELLVDLWISRLGQRIRDLFDLCAHAAGDPSDQNLRALFTLVNTAGPDDVAAIQLLLAARRLPTLYEEVEPFVIEQLTARAEDSDAASATLVRAVTLFSMMVAQIFAEAHLGADEEYRRTVEGVLTEVLRTDPAAVAVRPFEDTSNPPEAPTADDLRTRLAWATFLVVGRSGYTRATISRIARRANCSPGAIYKIHESKDDLVATSFRELMNVRWMRVKNFVRVLEEDSISTMLHRLTSREHSVRRYFTVEFILASPYSPALLDAIRAQSRGLEAVVAGLEHVSENDKTHLNHLIRAMTYLTVGVDMTSTLYEGLRSMNFTQFAEPFRRAVLRDCLPGWNELREQLTLASQRAR